jgi:acetyl-CoA carboxylase biotin carboxyl carrier protein
VFRVTHEKSLTFQDLVQIVELIKSSEHFSEVHLKYGDIELDVKRGYAGNGASPTSAAPQPAPQAATPPQPAPIASVRRPTQGALPENLPASAIVVTSPMVGTFYRASEPGSPPFVEVGASVASDATVCIIEVMKLMNSIEAGGAGVVTHILADDGAPVEFGQPLIVIESR